MTGESPPARLIPEGARRATPPRFRPGSRSEGGWQDGTGVTDEPGHVGRCEISDQVPRARVSRCESGSAMSDLGMPSLPCSQQLQPRSGGVLWEHPEKEEMEHSGQASGQQPSSCTDPCPAWIQSGPPAGVSLQPIQTRVMQTEDRRGQVKGVWKGWVGRRSAGDILDSPATPSWTLPYPASIYLPMEWAPEGSSGDRGTGQKLEQDAWPPWACVCSRWPPVGGPYQCCPWPGLPAPGLPTRAPGSRWNCAPAWEDVGRPG